MPTEIDKLQIEINAKATNANKSLDTLVVKLDALTSRLGKINGSSLVGLANGVNALGNSVKLIAGIDSRKFGSLATNISKISTLDTASINRAASAMNQLTRSLNSLGAVSQSAMQISQVASNVAKLGGVKVDKAITNLPKLTKGLSVFMRAMANTPQISRNIIDMTNALANLASQSRGVSTAANGLSNGLSRTNNSIKLTSKSTFSLAKAFGKFYASYFLVIRGIKGLWSSIEKTADYFEAFNYFNVAFDKIAREWNHQYAEYGYENGEAYADSFKDRMEETFAKLSGIEFDMDKGILSETGLKNLGLNIQQITQYASQLASVTNSLEFTGEASVATSQALVKLAGDISSLFNIDYDQVSSNLTSGLLGMSRSLYKYGIDITNATLQTYAYELGLSKAVSEMKQGEKAQLRWLAILEQSSVAWGDQANTINSLSNQMRVMKNTWSETSMIFGQLFVPMLEDALPVINGIVIALRRLLIEVAGFMGVEIDPNKFNTGMNESEDALDGITGELENATEAVKEYQNQLLGFDEINKLQEVDLSSKLDGDDGSLDLTDEILDATEEYEKVWNKAYENMENRAEQWADKISEYFTSASWFDKGQDVSNIVEGIYAFFSEAIRKVNWNEVGENIGDFLAGIDWIEILVASFRFKVDIAEALANAWFSSLKEAPIETALITALGVMKFTKFGQELSSKLATATNWEVVGGKIGKGVIGGLVAAIGGWNFGNAIYELFSGDDIDMTMTEQIAYLWNNSVFAKFWEKIKKESEIEVKVIEPSQETMKLLEDLNNLMSEASNFNSETIKSINELDLTKIETLATAYFNLADQQNRTNIENEKLKVYAEKLKDLVPDLIPYIDEETGAYKGQREELEKLISKRKQYLLAGIINERQSNLLELIIDSEQERKDLEDDYNSALKKEKNIWNGIWKEINRIDSAYPGMIAEMNRLLDTYSPDNLTGAYKQFYEDYIDTYNFYNELVDMATKMHEGNRDALAEEYQAFADIYEVINKYEESENTIKQLTEQYDRYQKAIDMSVDNTEDLIAILNGQPTRVEKHVDFIINTIDATSKYHKAIEEMKKNSTVPVNAEANTDKARQGFNSLVNSLAKTVIDIPAIINTTIDENSLKMAINKITNNLSSFASNIFGSLKLPMFATGGFPEDGLFMANHGELVGKFANGRTAVANNYQIEEGIENAAYRGMMRALLSVGGNNTNVNVTLQGDAKQMFRVVQQEANNYTMQTGQMAFS